ncbi:MAG: AtpZ/AtpI family protein [Alphaproteobacteria bacterium]|nr:AtpZ/AtpI family protein [Alphaproteobacteria bacterium]
MAPDDKKPPSLEDIDARLRKAREREIPGDGLKTPSSNLGRAFTLAIEMAAALAVGGGIGWYLDKWLDTKPWLLVVFLIIGIAAGVKNVMRQVKRITAEIDKQERDAAEEKSRSERPKSDQG